jgi:hypothetical protein
MVNINPDINAPNNPKHSLINGPARDDHIMIVTRVVSALVVPFVAVAFVILYILPYPDSLTNYFAWVIRPQMSAMLMGAGYMAGAYFFTRAAIAKKWHHIAIGFPGVTSFASLAGIATILHWDSFIQSHTPFYIWVALYATTPFIVPALWLVNRRTDPGTFDEHDTEVSHPLRLAVGVIGAAAFLTCALFIFAPRFMISIWPWQLSPATSRVGAAWFSLFAFVAMGFPFEKRWSAYRITLQSLMLALALFLIAVARAWSEFDKSNPITWLFVFAVIARLFAIVVIYILMERKSRIQSTTS